LARDSSFSKAAIAWNLALNEPKIATRYCKRWKDGSERLQTRFRRMLPKIIAQSVSPRRLMSCITLAGQM
jgi:hypothetical protein